MTPKYAPLDLALPTVELTAPPESAFGCRVFAQALLCGRVVQGVPPPQAQLLANPAVVLHAPTNPRVMGIVGPLWEHRVATRAGLLRRWAGDPRFLLEGLLRWLPAAVHDEVRASWPPASAR